MKKIDTLEDGIGVPDWKLALCLLLAWIIICVIMMKGVSFPICVFISLDVRTVPLRWIGTYIRSTLKIEKGDMEIFFSAA